MVDEHPIALCLLAALVVLAGCNFVPAGTTSTATPSPTASPTDVRTTAPPADTGVHKGLATDGIVDASALIAAHEQALADTNVTTRRTAAERYANGSLRYAERTRAWVASDHQRYHVVWTHDGAMARRYGAPERFEVWSNGSITLARVNNTGGTTYHRGSYRGPGFYQDRLVVALSGMETADVTPTTVNGTRAYRVVDRNVSTPRLIAMDSVLRPYEIEAVRDVTVAALIRQDGLIQHVVVRFTVETGTATLDVEERIRFTNVGSTNVTRPAWLPSALNQTAR